MKPLPQGRLQGPARPSAAARVAALINRARIGGQALTALLIVIIFLMVVKPGGVH